MIYAGIDPGLSGAIAFDCGGSWEIYDMPVVQGRTGKNQIAISTLAAILRDYEISHAFIEDVHAMPKQGVSSSFNFGFGCGVIQGVVSTLKIPYTVVTPQKWKKAMGVTADKDSSRARAMQLFPEAGPRFARKKDDGRAEAALIVRYGMIHVLRVSL